MKFAGKILAFLVYSNLFIAGCAVVMTEQTSRLLLGEHASFTLLAFIFFSTLCSYSFHWYLTSQSVIPSPRIQWTTAYRILHGAGFIIGLAGAIIFFIPLIGSWYWLMGGAIITFLYTAPKIPHPWLRALRKVALGKTIFLAMVWTYVTTVLPLVIGDHIFHTDRVLFIIGRFFLLYAICILFDYRDREDDKAAGIRSLITYLSRKWIFLLFLFSIIISAIATISLSAFGYNEVIITILLLPCVITMLLYRYATRNFADLLFYLVLDGLMALSALIMLITGI